MKRSGKNTVCTDPARGDEVIGRYPVDSKPTVMKAVRRGREAQQAWASLPDRKRASILLPLRERLSDRADLLAAIISRNTGKPRNDALAAEILPAVLSVGYHCRNASRFLASRRLPPASLLLSNKRSVEYRVPYGVVGIISPWNYPFSIPFSEVLTALLAGNAVVLKTATMTLAVGRALADLFGSIDMPEGLFQLVNIPGKDAGRWFVEAGVDKIFFTGSEAAGRSVMTEAAKRLIPVVLELGGNDAMIVCGDADVDRAAAGALWAGYSNAGQSCGGIQRIYVVGKAYAPFLERLKKNVSSLRVGADGDFRVDMGPLITRELADEVSFQIRESVKKGAVIAACSSAPESSHGSFLPAMVLTGRRVKPDAPILRDEVFGPVTIVLQASTAEEAIRAANDSDFGLTASVWSRNRAQARKIARRLEAGSVTINDHLMSHGLAETPWGGFKRSGFGRTHGRTGFDEMTRTRVVVDDILPFVKKGMWMHPYSEKVYQGLKGIVELVSCKGFVRRLSGLFRSIGVGLRYFRKG